MFKQKARLIFPLILFVAVAATLLLTRHVKAPTVKVAKSIVASSTAPNQLSTTTVTVGQQTFVVEVAQTPSQQEQGLSDRTDLATNSGMLFPFNPPVQASFWMKEMRFSLDIVWIRDGRVVGVSRRLPPPPPGSATIDLPLYRSPTAVDYVLEVNAGQADSIKVGDQVTLVKTREI